jgi:hypothetical protein
MARGKKTRAEDIYKVMLSYFTTGNFVETSEMTGVPVTTVHDICKRHYDDPEFEILRKQKQDEFVRKADKIIMKAMDRLERTLDNEELIIPSNHLSTVIGTMYDKRALAKGEPTANEKLSIKIELTD